MSSNPRSIYDRFLEYHERANRDVVVFLDSDAARSIKHLRRDIGKQAGEGQKNGIP